MSAITGLQITNVERFKRDNQWPNKCTKQKWNDHLNTCSWLGKSTHNSIWQVNHDNGIPILYSSREFVSLIHVQQSCVIKNITCISKWNVTFVMTHGFTKMWTCINQKIFIIWCYSNSNYENITIRNEGFGYCTNTCFYQRFYTPKKLQNKKYKSGNVK